MDTTNEEIIIVFSNIGIQQEEWNNKITPRTHFFFTTVQKKYYKEHCGVLALWSITILFW